MSKAKFTKGEWESSLDCGGKTLIHSDGEIICEGIVCSNYKEEVEPHRIEARANVDLIVTAPEMYEMLDELSALDECQMFKQEIKKILAKARGEK
mgnify:CR=1 FL=1|tara:strand:+ start:28054 stop:28338 length:285 start_codon:yes stop_codon:yes gene_type:complete